MGVLTTNANHYGLNAGAPFDLSESVWSHLERRVASAGFTIEHPKGSTHLGSPAAVFPLDYGRLNGSRSVNGLTGIFAGSDPGLGVTGLLVAYDPSRTETRVSVAYGCTVADMSELEAFGSPDLSPSVLVRRRRPRPALVVFDAMGVLYQAADDVAEVLLPYLRQKGCRLRETQIEGLYRSASLGRLTSMEFWALCGVLGDDAEYCAGHRLMPGIGLLLGDLRLAGVPVACLSNDLGEWSRVLRQHFRLNVLIDPWVISGDVGHRKPDVTAFAALSQIAGVPLEQMLFFDDRKDNVDAARSVGMDAVIFSGVDQARATLRDRSVLPEP